MSTTEQVKEVISIAQRLRIRDHHRAVNSRLELLRRLLCSCGYTNVDTSYHRQSGEIIIRQYAPVLDAARVLDIIDPPMAQWGWHVVDVWECYAAEQPYNRFVQVKAIAPPLDTNG